MPENTNISEKEHKFLQEYALDNITGNIVLDYIRTLVPEKKEYLKEIEKQCIDEGYAQIQPEISTFLSVICKIKRPKKILEIGTCVGYSAFVMLEACRDNTDFIGIDTIERYEYMYVRAKENIKKYDADNKINLIYKSAAEALADFSEKDFNTYDLVFLDGAKAQYPRFLPYITNLLRSGGVLVADNVLFKGMTASEELITHRRHKTISRRLDEFLKEISFSGKYDASVLPAGDGIAVAVKK